MNQNFAKLAAAAVITTSLFASNVFAQEAPKAEEPSFKLTGNVQAQAIKAVYDNDADNTLDNSFLRANIGGKYTSSDFEAVINLRIFSPAFGNKNVTDVTVDQNGNVKATKSAQDRFSADTYYAKYKWDTGFGDFSVTSHFKLVTCFTLLIYSSGNALMCMQNT